MNGEVLYVGHEVEYLNGYDFYRARIHIPRASTQGNPASREKENYLGSTVGDLVRDIARGACGEKIKIVNHVPQFVEKGILFDNVENNRKVYVQCAARELTTEEYDQLAKQLIRVLKGK